MNSDIHASSVLSQAAAQKLEVTVGEKTNHLALLKIHGQLQFSFQKLLTRFQHVLRRPFAFAPIPELTDRKISRKLE